MWEYQLPQPSIKFWLHQDERRRVYEEEDVEPSGCWINPLSKEKVIFKGDWLGI